MAAAETPSRPTRAGIVTMPRPPRTRPAIDRVKLRRSFSITARATRPAADARAYGPGGPSAARLDSTRLIAAASRQSRGCLAPDAARVPDNFEPICGSANDEQCHIFGGGAGFDGDEGSRRAACGKCRRTHGALRRQHALASSVLEHRCLLVAGEDDDGRWRHGDRPRDQRQGQVAAPFAP